MRLNDVFFWAKSDKAPSLPLSRSDVGDYLVQVVYT